jgi:hypothetical protein
MTAMDLVSVGRFDKKLALQRLLPSLLTGLLRREQSTDLHYCS